MRKFAISLCFALVPAVVAVLANAGAGTQNPPPAPQGDPNPIVFAPGRLVPIGGGRTLYLKCEGNGTPTVILVAGRGGTAEGWTPVQDALARTTQTCAYDRAGLGNSLPGPGHTETEQIADLQRLLRRAALPAPYVLVGAAYGGRLVHLYARAHPSETRAVVRVGGSAHASGQPSVAAVLAIVRRARTG